MRSCSVPPYTLLATSNPNLSSVRADSHAHDRIFPSSKLFADAPGPPLVIPAFRSETRSCDPGHSVLASDEKTTVGEEGEGVDGAWRASGFG